MWSKIIKQKKRFLHIALFRSIQTHLLLTNWYLSQVIFTPKQSFSSSHSIKKKYVGRFYEWEKNRTQRNNKKKKNRVTKNKWGGTFTPTTNQQTKNEKKTMMHSEPNMKIMYQMKWRKTLILFSVEMVVVDL